MATQAGERFRCEVQGRAIASGWFRSHMQAVEWAIEAANQYGAEVIVYRKTVEVAKRIFPESS